MVGDCLLPSPTAGHQHLQGPREPRRQSSGSWGSASRFLPPGFPSLLNNEGSIWSQYLRQKDSSRKAPCFLGWQLPWGDEERTDPPGEALGASVKPSPVPPLTPIPRPGPQPPPSPRSAAFPPPAQPPGAAALDLDYLSLLSLCLMLWPERPEDERPPDRPPCPGLAPPEESTMTALIG